MNERQQQLRAGVDEDGVVDGYEVETYLASINMLEAPHQYGYEVDKENLFVEFIIDNGGTDLAVRLPFELIEVFYAKIKEGTL